MEIVGEFIRRARFTIIGTRHDFRSWVTGEIPTDKDETTSWEKFDQLAQEMNQVAGNIIEKFVNTMPEEKLAWMNDHQQQQRNDAMLEHAMQLSLQQPVGSTPSVAVETEFDDDKDLRQHNHKHQTSSSATTATQTMDKMLMAKLKPTTEQWEENQPGYHAKAFHLLLNKYQRNDSIDPHQDKSRTYDARNPITSLSYGRGSILTIQDSNKPTKQKTALYYQFPGDAIIMSGTFNLKFWHGVPPVDSWRTLFEKENIVRRLPKNELDEANKVFDGAEMCDRFNVTIRWHESHYDGCPYKCGSVAQIAIPKSHS